jgi:ADP-heptose:LPS heptosyltransferase
LVTTRSGTSDLVPQHGHVAILRALPGLGDLLCAVPALRALRTARPDVEVTYIGLPDTRNLLERFAGYIDHVLDFPGFPGLPDRRPDIRRIPSFLEEAQRTSFDLVVQLHGSGELTNSVAALLGGRRTAGHYLKPSAPPDPALFLPWIAGCSEVRRNLRLMAHLGWPSDDEHLEFPVELGADERLDTIDEVAALRGRPFVCLHPGAAGASRRWSPAGFAQVGDELAEAGLSVVLTGTAGERELTALVGSLMHQPSLDLTGRTSLDTLAALYRRAALLVCNDTGVSHLAAALGTPSVVVFRDSDPRRWAPLDDGLHRPVFGSVRHVVSEARKVLRRTQRHAA